MPGFAIVALAVAVVPAIALTACVVTVGTPFTVMLSDALLLPPEFEAVMV